MQVQGSSIAHTQLAFADDSLWLWGITNAASTINQVSSTTGEVERTITDVPPIGGTEPLMVATPNQLWLSGGPGGGAELARINTQTGLVASGPPIGSSGRASSGQPTVGASAGNVVWMVAQGDEVFAGVREITGAGPGTGSPYIVAINGDGAIRTGAYVGDQFGTWAVTNDAGVWTIGPGEQCNAGQALSYFDPGALTARTVTTMNPNVNPCVGGGFRRFAAVGTHLFVLDSDTTQSTQLYGITP